MTLVTQVRGGDDRGDTEGIGRSKLESPACCCGGGGMAENHNLIIYFLRSGELETIRDG